MRQLEIFVKKIISIIECFNNSVRMNLICNCPVTIRDIEFVEYIWVKDIGALKGKTALKMPTQVKKFQYNLPYNFI